MKTSAAAVVAIAVVLVVAAVVGGILAGVWHGQQTTRQIQVACISQHGSWISGHCLYPVGR